ncbi:hypothetical protein KI688_012927 [Linnemannia hyalina]|uniref:Uncharacterized protein n=1 Tax=Linnemannia hyalina TaxID=64524 RepID=A0A9P8BSY5_9FUNG|nr:hypothetical protein KI688_012927 [Linnemannia hyalina]
MDFRIPMFQEAATWLEKNWGFQTLTCHQPSRKRISMVDFLNGALVICYPLPTAKHHLVVRKRHAVHLRR